VVPRDQGVLPAAPSPPQARARGLLTPVVVAVGQLVPDDGADPAIVQRPVVGGAEARGQRAGMAVTPGSGTPTPALAAPTHAPAPHSLRELGVVEGGLQDAGREHWGHRRALQLGEGTPCPVPTHSTTGHPGTLRRAPPQALPLPHPGGWAMPHPSGSCWAGSRRSALGEAAATCKERQRCQASGGTGGGASKSHHLAQFWGQGDIPVLPGALLPTPYRGQPGMGTGALMGPCCAPHAPSPGKGIPTRTCPPPAGSSSPRA